MPAGISIPPLSRRSLPGAVAEAAAAPPVTVSTSTPTHSYLTMAKGGFLNFSKVCPTLPPLFSNRRLTPLPDSHPPHPHRPRSLPHNLPLPPPPPPPTHRPLQPIPPPNLHLHPHISPPRSPPTHHPSLNPHAPLPPNLLVSALSTAQPHQQLPLLPQLQLRQPLQRRKRRSYDRLRHTRAATTAKRRDGTNGE